MKKISLYILLCFATSNAFSQTKNASTKWVDSVFATLNKDQRIAQLMVVRLSSIDSKTKVVSFYDAKVMDLIKKYNIGGVCLFQGSPVKQAEIINKLQAKAKTPLLMCIDAEWGVGMRIIDSVLPLPRQMMLGAMKNEGIVYQYGKLVAEQCKRIGVQVNYAPVVDVNNNPNNPIINDRSFGENKYKVAAFGIQYMKGMQDNGVMACAKHFPGHGDVSVDSHLDLPVINKSIAELDSLEFYPFRKIFDAGIGSVMLAHLYIPAIDATANRATSLSPANVNELMRKKMNYQGLTFTDALEMQGVKKFFPNGEASVQSIIAGNDMLCLPEDVATAIKKIKDAIAKKLIAWADIDMHCKKVLAAKYQYGLNKVVPINTINLAADLNNGIASMRRLVAENAITLIAKENLDFFPLRDTKPGEIAYIGFGITADNEFARKMRNNYNATVFYGTENELLKKVSGYKKIVIGLHNVGRSPASNFNFSASTLTLLNKLQANKNSISFLFGNAYALKNMCNTANMVLCYEDDEVTQATAIELLEGKLFFKGELPVTVCENLKFGAGIQTTVSIPLFEKINSNIYNQTYFDKIDAIIQEGIAKKAMPGAVALAIKDGKIIFEKAYGSFEYDNKEPVKLNAVYDMASVTKICATTLSIMKLYEEGKIDLKKKIGAYLPETINTNKQNIIVKDILLHQAGLVPYIPFYKETMDSNGKPLTSIYSNFITDSNTVYVAPELYMKKNWSDTIYKRILQSPVTENGKYVYSDNDFIFLGKIIEAVSGLTMDEYVLQNFYKPMQLQSIGYDPLQRNFANNIAPTEDEKYFRNQVIRTTVHDPGAAMMGGVAGHAGLFSNAYDIAAVMQMVLNEGFFNGKQYLKKETINLFTAYNAASSRRGLGFDKPEKDNDTRKEPYPCKEVSAETFGHTGFTGTCTWADPVNKLVFVFLSNRVNPEVNSLFSKMDIRGKVLGTLYNMVSKMP
jgi:beta-N-acetylhexosaminidase